MVLHQQAGATLGRMPTTRRRHTITETEPIARALAVARRRWPDEEPASLLRRLTLAGAEAVAGAADAESDRRRTAIRRHAGALAGCYEPGYLERVRAEWPE